MLKIIGLVIGIVVIVGLFNLGKAANKDQATSNHASSGWSQIHEGMTENEVLSILGQPSDKTSSNVGGTQVDDWMWGTLASTTYDVTFEDGTVYSYTKM